MHSSNTEGGRPGSLKSVYLDSFSLGKRQSLANKIGVGLSLMPQMTTVRMMELQLGKSPKWSNCSTVTGSWNPFWSISSKLLLSHSLLISSDGKLSLCWTLLWTVLQKAIFFFMVRYIYITWVCTHWLWLCPLMPWTISQFNNPAFFSQDQPFLDLNIVNIPSWGGERTLHLAPTIC